MKNLVIRHPRTGREFLLNRQHMLDNPYHGARRRDPKTRRFIVVHHTAGNTAGDLSVLRGKAKRQVSVKYLVADPADGNYRDDKGRLIVYQLLKDDVIGWSVGKTTGKYDHVTNANSDSIEISNRGDGKDVFETQQLEAVEALVAFEESRLGQNLDVLSHADIAPGRKNDPHKSFDLARVKAWAKAVLKGVLPRKVKR